MSEKKSIKELSKLDWAIDQYPPSHEWLQIGCLQRIADACELMAGNYSRLIEERNRLIEERKRAWAENESMARSNAALRGVIRKLKKGTA